MTEDIQASVHQLIIASMHDMALKMGEEDVTLTMPPPSMQTLQVEYIEMIERKMLTARIPFHSSFRSPTGVMQGGFLCTAFDEVFGPLTYMVSGRPAVTLHMETSLIRPFQEHHGFVVVRAEVISASRVVLLLQATAMRPDGKMLAIAKVHCIVSRS